MTEALEIPMEQEEELRIWEAFKQAAPTALTGQQEEDPLDKDRAHKFRKPDGKGETRGSEGDGGRPSKGQGQHRGNTPSRGGGRWDSQNWGGGNWRKQDHDDALQSLKAMVSQLAKLCLRHEDSINLWRAESSYVLFVRTGIPGSLVPALYAAKSEWQKLKEETTEKIKRPMRCILFSCLLKEMSDRLKLLQSDKERRASMEKLGWLQKDDFQRLRWDAKMKKHVRDDEAASISYEDVLTVIQSMMTKCNTVEALLRFHPTRPLTEQMQEGTVAFCCSFRCRVRAGFSCMLTWASFVTAGPPW